MGKFYKLYPKEFYVLNDLLPVHFIEDQPHLMMTTIDFRNRCFNYNAIDPERKRFSDEIYGNVIRYLKADKDLFLRYIEEYFPKSQHERYRAAVDRFTKKNPGVPTYEDKVELHYYLVDLYHFFPNHPGKHLDGILRKIETRLAGMGLRFRYVTIDPLVPEEHPHGELPWAKMRFYGYDDADKAIKIPLDLAGKFSEEIIANQDDLRILEKGPDRILNEKKIQTGKAENQKQGNDNNPSDIFFRYLYPLFFDPKFDALKKQEDISEIPFWSFIVFPVYSAELAGEGCYGTIIGHLHLSFSDEDERVRYLAGVDGKPDASWDTLTMLISRTLLEGRSYSIVEEDSQSYDSLKDLIANIGLLQDWEKIFVFANASGAEPEFCYKRFPGQEKDHVDYAQVWAICEKEKDCKGCNKGFYENLIHFVHGHGNENVLTPFEHRIPFCDEDTGRCFFSQRLGEILDLTILPTVEIGDIERYKQYILVFEFPECTFYPIVRDSKKRAIGNLGEHYVKKLIPIFDRILLKKKVLQNSIRSAVSAIIGRNMSHNIGSHVLSYGPASLKTAATNLAQVRFYEYLRQRMDFIAEICTADPSWHSSMNLIRDILIPFLRQDMLLNHILLSEGVHRDMCEEEDCLKSHHNMQFKVLIGDKTCFEAKSKQVFPDHEFSYKLNDEGQFIPEKYFFRKKDPEQLIIRDDIAVSIPHGIIGCHAFYSILENLIRNSAKHGQSWLKKGKGFEVVISIDETAPDFVKLNLADNMGNCNNQLKNKLSSGLDPSREPLVDNEGRLNSGNLGLKEMRVCANFLRMRPTNQADVKTSRQTLWPDEIFKKPLIELDCENRICSRDRACEKPNLQYALYLFKPKEALVICSDQESKKMEKENLDRLQKQGIYFQDIETFKTSHRMSLFHRFLAVQKDLSRDLKDYFKPQVYQIPQRVVPVDAPENVSIEGLYKKWIKKIDPEFDNLKIVWRGSHSEGIEDIFCTKSRKIPGGTKILFDNHGECNRDGGGCLFYQPYRGDERIYRLLYTIAREKESQRLRFYELIEAAVTNVIIADERIWKKTAGNLTFGPKLMSKATREVLNDMRIRLVPIENNRASLKTVKQVLSKTDTEAPCFFIMHQGIIDKMNDQEQNDFDQIIAEYQNRLDHFTYVVTSGRGIPDFSHKAKFIEISNLEVFIEERDKYSLVQTLFALRRPHNGQ